jgi:hypothetical protein
MKRFAIVFALLAMFVVSGCSHVSLQAVENVDKSGELIFPEYLKYVDADAALKPEDKADRRKLIESHRRNVEALKKSAQ